MKKLFILATCLGMLGCQAEEENDHQVHTNTSVFPSAYQVQFSPDLIPFADNILLSFQQWSEKAGTKFSITVTNEDCSSFLSGCIQLVASTRELLEQKYNGPVGGFTSRRNNVSVVEIATDLQGSQWGYICLHEIGHALGLKHSESLESVMYYKWTVKSVPVISEEDIQNYNNLR